LVVLPDAEYRDDMDLQILRELKARGARLTCWWFPVRPWTRNRQSGERSITQPGAKAACSMPLTSLQQETLDWFERAAADLEDARQLAVTRPHSENVV
jgi:hypothetical protein